MKNENEKVTLGLTNTRPKQSAHNALQDAQLKRQKQHQLASSSAQATDSTCRRKWFTRAFEVATRMENVATDLTGGDWRGRGQLLVIVDVRCCVSAPPPLRNGVAYQAPLPLSSALPFFMSPPPLAGAVGEMSMWSSELATSVTARNARQSSPGCQMLQPRARKTLPGSRRPLLHTRWHSPVLLRRCPVDFLDRFFSPRSRSR